MRIFRILSLALALATASPALAQQDGGSYGESYGGMDGGSASAGLSRATTRAVTRTLKRDIAWCRKLQTVSRYDCYRQTYVQASKILNGRPDYAEAQKALDHVADALDRVIDHYADPQAPRAHRVFQTFTAIKPSALPAAKKTFAKALDEAETQLLRSANKDNVHFARIAEAIHSNKVLLRSLLLDPTDASPLPLRVA